MSFLIERISKKGVSHLFNKYGFLVISMSAKSFGAIAVSDIATKSEIKAAIKHAKSKGYGRAARLLEVELSCQDDLNSGVFDSYSAL